jgi:hypothetical protein
MVLASVHLARQRTRMRAYNMLQAQLMACFIRRGGSAEAWCARYAVAFRRRFGWMLAGP